jgi:hypothetical protein
MDPFLSFIILGGAAAAALRLVVYPNATSDSAASTQNPEPSPLPAAFDPARFNVAVVGQMMAGKSTLIHRLTQKPLDSPTNLPCLTPHNVPDTTITLWELPSCDEANPPDTLSYYNYFRLSEYDMIWVTYAGRMYPTLPPVVADCLRPDRPPFVIVRAKGDRDIHHIIMTRTSGSSVDDALRETTEAVKEELGLSDRDSDVGVFVVSSDKSATGGDTLHLQALMNDVKAKAQKKSDDVADKVHSDHRKEVAVSPTYTTDSPEGGPPMSTDVKQSEYEWSFAWPLRQESH